MKLKRNPKHRKFLICALLLFTFTTSLVKAQSPADVTQRDFYYSTFKAHLLLERYIPKGAILFFGDSLIQGLELESLHRYPVNFGITGDTTAGLLHRVKEYQSLKIADAVVLESGINDLGFGKKFDKKIVQNYRRILAGLPPRLDIYIIGIFPVNETINSEFAGYNKRIKAINIKLSVLCNSNAKCVFIDVGDKLRKKDGNLFRTLLRPNDAIHLNDIGKSIVLETIRSKLRTPQSKVDVQDSLQNEFLPPSLGPTPEHGAPPSFRTE